MQCGVSKLENEIKLTKNKLTNKSLNKFLKMENQNYSTHKRFVPLFHYFLFPLVVVTLIGSLVNLFKSVGDSERIYSASLIASISVSLLLMFFFMRIFALRAQDRAIRAEENLRHFALTGKLLDARLTMSQVIALRFAEDEEFIELAKKAADTTMSSDNIKKAIQKWKADHHRA